MQKYYKRKELPFCSKPWQLWQEVEQLPTTTWASSAADDTCSQCNNVVVATRPWVPKPTWSLTLWSSSNFILFSTSLEWYFRAYLSSTGCQLLSQGFQFLLLNKQLLVVSLSQRLEGKNPLHPTSHTTQKLQSKQGAVRQALCSEGNPKKSSTWQTGQALLFFFFYLQQLAFVGAGRPDVAAGHFIDLSPEVSVLLFESLQLCLGLGDRVAGFEAQAGDKVLFSTFGGHDCFTGATQKKELHKEKDTSPRQPQWHI